jgi:hypothetical protein
VKAGSGYGFGVENPSTKAKPSAEADETPDELRARLLQLAEDYVAAFHRNPTEENLQTAQLLRAIGESSDLRQKLHGQRTSLLNEAHGFGHAWQRWYWVGAIPAAVEGRDGDALAVARDLILWMPVPLRVKCPSYPTNEAELQAAVAAVVRDKEFEPELTLLRNGQRKNGLRVGRAVLRGLGLTKDKAKSQLRKSTFEKWTSKQTSRNPPAKK